MIEDILRMAGGSAKHFDVDVDMGEFVAKKTPAHISVDFGRSSNPQAAFVKTSLGL